MTIKCVFKTYVYVYAVYAVYAVMEHILPKTSKKNEPKNLINLTEKCSISRRNYVQQQ
jgi:hypothetical protein